MLHLSADMQRQFLRCLELATELFECAPLESDVIELEGLICREVCCRSSHELHNRSLTTIKTTTPRDVSVKGIV